MANQTVDVVVVGGNAGAVIAHKLAELRYHVALLWDKDIPGATHTNQKWLHSGILYPSPALAAKAWKNRKDDWKLKKQYLTGPGQAYFLALNPETINDKVEMWQNWRDGGYDVPTFTELTSEDKTSLHKANINFDNFAGGWVTPDCVIDFPSMVRDLRLSLEGTHCVMEGAKFLGLRHDSYGITVDVDWRGTPSTLSCKHCVLAAGAWSYELLRNIGVRHLPLIRKKCPVLVIKRAALPVSQITVCLDVTKGDGTLGDVSLVPFYDEVLAAGTDFEEVTDLEDHRLQDLQCNGSEVEKLKTQLIQCFPKVRELKADEYTWRTCFKFEQYNPDHPDVEPKIYTNERASETVGHGIPGLIVALPGKASLMFDLAGQVAGVVKREGGAAI